MKKRDQFLWMGYWLTEAAQVLLLAIVCVFGATARMPVFPPAIHVLSLLFVAAQWGLFLVACRHLSWKSCWKMAGIGVAVTLLRLIAWLILWVLYGDLAHVVVKTILGDMAFWTVVILMIPVLAWGLWLKRRQTRYSSIRFCVYGTLGCLVLFTILALGIMVPNRISFYFQVMNSTFIGEAGKWEIIVEFSKIFWGQWLKYCAVCGLLPCAATLGTSLLASLPWRREEQAALAAARQAETAPAAE